MEVKSEKIGNITLLNGNCLTLLSSLPEGSVDCCVTSPPYWGLRDYNNPHQLGLEVTPEEYVANQVAVFREVRRVLSGNGTLWLNLGDCYADAGRSHGRRAKDAGGVSRPSHEKTCERCGEPFIGGLSRRFCSSYCGGSDNSKRANRPGGLKHKDLIGMPWKLAFALQADGWYLRQDIIWHKPNAMPESVTDRPTKSHEYIFLLSKSGRYHYDHGAVKEDAVSGAKRNKRSVWSIATRPFPDAHFATYPPELIEPCILAGCPTGGTVLDPYFGAGTTGLVADRLGRNCIGIELNPEYAAIARKRLSDELGMFAGGAVPAE